MNTNSVLLCFGLFLLVITGCTSPSSDSTRSAQLQRVTDTVSGNTDTSAVQDKQTPGQPASSAEILARKQVPILCYHQIRDFRTKDSERAKDYIVPPAKFSEQMKRLADSGYKTILPEELMAYLQYGRPLPAKPVMLHFDDGDVSQYDVAKPVLDQYGFKACYFIMTVVLNKPGYMKREQVKQLSDEGNVIGSHT